MSYKEINTVEEAFKRYGATFTLPQMKLSLAFLPPALSRGMIALAILQVGCYTVNNDDPEIPVWLPDFNDEDQEKYTPWHYGGAPDGSGSGWSFRGSGVAWTSTLATGGARLALKDEGRSDHMEKYFSSWYKELELILTT